MLKKTILVVMLFALVGGAKAQTSTLILRPDSGVGKDASITKETPNTNNGSDENYICNAWTSGGAFHQRSLLEFDLSSLPSNAIITSANLALYCNTTSAHTQRHSNYPGSPYSSNESTIYRITGSWTESTVTWQNAPTFTSDDSVLIPASTSATQNYTNIDVVAMVNTAWNDTGNHSKVVGMLLKLNNETKYRSLIFASSDHPDSTKRPELTITYTLVNDTADSTTGIYTHVTSDVSVNVFPNPSKGLINIDLKNNSNVVYISIVNSFGSIVYRNLYNKHTITTPIAIDLTDKPSGAYVINISNEKGVQQSRKIFISNSSN